MAQDQIPWLYYFHHFEPVRHSRTQVEATVGGSARGCAAVEPTAFVTFSTLWPTLVMGL
jgi:hypothetical protein